MIREDAAADGAALSPLAQLIEPVGAEEFLTNCWERDWLHVRRDGDGRYGGLLSVADLDELVTYHKHAVAPAFAVADQSKPVPQKGWVTAADAAAAYRRGATVLIPLLHERWPSVAQLCGVLSETLRHPVGATAVLTPPRCQGLLPHADNQDAFILQIEGEKLWQVDAPARVLPLRHEPTPRELSQAAHDVDLRTGDLLYMPRGFPHVARTEGAHSLHVTLYVDVVRWHDVLVKAIEYAAYDDVSLRQAVPPGVLGSPDAAAAMPAKFRERVERFAANASVAGPLSAVARAVTSNPPRVEADDLERAVGPRRSG